MSGQERLATSPAGLSREAMNASFARVVASISSLVLEETQALRANRPFDLAGSNARKSRLLYDFNCACRAIDLAQLDPGLRTALGAMKDNLEQNMRQCRAHAAAVQEIVTMFMDRARERDDDGTYTMRSFDEF